jgi:hypothetical protein
MGSMSKLMRGSPLLLLLLALVAACSTNGVGTRAGRSDMITLQDLQAANSTNLYDAVRAIRPNWLRARSPNSLQRQGQVQVYFDDTRVGGVESLRNLPMQGIAYLQWFDPITASARWGLDHEQGAIVVSTRPQQ